ncbi:hypothetical protein BpHYR1_019051 [Brachionus plicatilis]|uniref:Uncharacterized protein n=1 Tax=Brachionus plicatilis TaxID=10195 RepID=A0A3M7P554_BRAPC|nr:hypothetical protein BpHYR1_019051 [Brachionus plicatilis]
MQKFSFQDHKSSFGKRKFYSSLRLAHSSCIMVRNQPGQGEFGLIRKENLHSTGGPINAKMQINSKTPSIELLARLEKKSNLHFVTEKKYGNQQKRFENKRFLIQSPETWLAREALQIFKQ